MRVDIIDVDVDADSDAAKMIRVPVLDGLTEVDPSTVELHLCMPDAPVIRRERAHNLTEPESVSEKIHRCGCVFVHQIRGNLGHLSLPCVDRQSKIDTIPVPHALGRASQASFANAGAGE